MTRLVASASTCGLKKITLSEQARNGDFSEKPPGFSFRGSIETGFVLRVLGLPSGARREGHSGCSSSGLGRIALWLSLYTNGSSHCCIFSMNNE